MGGAWTEGFQADPAHWEALQSMIDSYPGSHNTACLQGCIATILIHWHTLSPIPPPSPPMLPPRDNAYLPCLYLSALAHGPSGLVKDQVPSSGLGLRGPRLAAHVLANRELLMLTGGFQSSDARSWVQMNGGFLLGSCVPRNHVLFLIGAAVWALAG